MHVNHIACRGAQSNLAHFEDNGSRNKGVPGIETGAVHTHHNSPARGESPSCSGTLGPASTASGLVLTNLRNANQTMPRKPDDNTTASKVKMACGATTLHIMSHPTLQRQETRGHAFNTYPLDWSENLHRFFDTRNFPFLQVN